MPDLYFNIICIFHSFFFKLFKSSFKSMNSLEPLICRSAEAFGKLINSIYPCAGIVLDSPPNEVDIETSDNYNNYDNESGSYSHSLVGNSAVPQKDSNEYFPSWYHFPYLDHTNYTRNESEIVISPWFYEIYQERSLVAAAAANNNNNNNNTNNNNRSEDKYYPRIAVHVTHIPEHLFNESSFCDVHVNVYVNGTESFGRKSSVTVMHTSTNNPHHDCDNEGNISYNLLNPENGSMIVAFYFPQYHSDFLNNKL